MKSNIKTLYTILILVVSIFIWSIGRIEVQASTPQNSIELMSEMDKYVFANELANGIVKGSMVEIQKKATYFTSECYLEITRFVNRAQFEGLVSHVVTDFITQNNNTNGDLTMLINVKVQNGISNNLYLFEFHIDRSGIIYGFNLWGY